MCRALLILLSFFYSSCATNTGTGAITGTILGAGTGSLLGSGAGAAIGGAVGVVSGTAMGAILDAQDRKVVEKSSPRTVDRIDHGDPLTISDVIKLSQSGVSDPVIISYIQESKSIYQLSQAQVRRLREGGVSQRVIETMVETGR